MTIEPVSVADAVGSHLRTMLLSGAFAAGSELKDAVIAKQLGVARPTARVAVQKLVAEGLLERPPGHSARVRTFEAADVADIYHVRRLIEFEAVRIVTTQNRSTDDIAAALERFERVGESWEAGPDADAQFHSAVVRSTGSLRLTRMFVGLASEMRLMIALLRPHYSTLKELYAEHTELLRVLNSRDTEAALDQWASHLEDAETYLITSLEKESS